MGQKGRNSHLIFVAVFCLSLCFVAQAQRQLAPGPYSEEDIVIQRCLDLTTAAGNACTIESDISALVYPRDSTELPTSDQIVRAISNMRAAALPSSNCCEQLKPYTDAACPCLPGYQQILPIGGFDKAYFEGATNILALACRIPFAACSDNATQAAEQPAAVAAAGPSPEAASTNGAAVGATPTIALLLPLLLWLLIFL